MVEPTVHVGDLNELCYGGLGCVLGMRERGVGWRLHPEKEGAAVLDTTVQADGCGVSVLLRADTKTELA